MYTQSITCRGRFDYLRHSVCAIIKILDCGEFSCFTNGNYYPIVFDYTNKMYFLFDDKYCLNECVFSNSNIDEILRMFCNSECIFEISCYINYHVDYKILHKTFTIDFSLKEFSTKIKSKNYSHLFDKNVKN